MEKRPFMFWRRVRTRPELAAGLAAMLALVSAAGPTCQAQCETAAAPAAPPIAAEPACHEPGGESQGAREPRPADPCGRGASPCVTASARPAAIAPPAAPLVGVAPAIPVAVTLVSAGFVSDPRPFPSPPPVRLSAVLRL
jgi:hypothetical protein